MSGLINTILTELMNIILLFICIASVSYVAYKVFNYKIFDFRLDDEDSDDAFK